MVVKQSSRQDEDPLGLPMSTRKPEQAPASAPADGPRQVAKTAEITAAITPAITPAPMTTSSTIREAYKYIRIGTLPKYSDVREEDDLIDMIYVVVAEIQREPKPIRYLAVRSWNINGILTGSYTRPQVLNQLQGIGLAVDPFFATLNPAQMESSLLLPWDEVNPNERPRDAPVKPFRAKTITTRPCDIRKLEAGECTAVVDFVDIDGAMNGLELRVNYQVGLQSTETLQEVRDFFGGSRFEAPLETSRTLDELVQDFKCQFHIYVLPQGAGKRMRRWNDVMGYKFGAYLNEDMWKVHKQMFIQIVIMRERKLRTSRELSKMLAERERN
ncbi:uncharacterized protein RCC_04724 [Ramularia collo-cygni]|uniref:Uncharacterized protein n=1 Tax=Ramularia collo-cygni TaxID=112498 RepID=A0A2D3VBB6_9PEZI|nr:uncharacterized protein RCC_04724 [Ramularia collo-cygni]CZT18879.1 uncharacterized protein RCC_04724 [Ramularia collo-cygni]